MTAEFPDKNDLPVREIDPDLLLTMAKPEQVYLGQAAGMNRRQKRRWAAEEMRKSKAYAKRGLIYIYGQVLDPRNPLDRQAAQTIVATLKEGQQADHERKA